MEPINMPKFRHPFTMVISGSTGTGKTEWLMRFLNAMDRIIEPQVQSVLYCYGEANKNTMELAKRETINALQSGHDKNGKNTWIPVHTYNGVPSEALIKQEAAKSSGRLLLVLDDLIVNLKSEFLDPLFTRGSHNWGVSVIVVTQHLFSKELRIARSNSHYLCLMRNPAGELQIRNLAIQTFPLQHRYFMEAYRDATAQPYSYLLVDLHPSTDNRIRLRTHIFAPDETCIVYVPKS